MDSKIDREIDRIENGFYDGEDLELHDKALKIIKLRRFLFSDESLEDPKIDDKWQLFLTEDEINIKLLKKDLEQNMAEKL